MVNTKTTAGRPRINVKYPRKVRFTVQEVLDLNDCCAPTVRSDIHRLVKLAQLVIVGSIKNEAGRRGRPRLLFAKSASESSLR